LAAAGGSPQPPAGPTGNCRRPRASGRPLPGGPWPLQPLPPPLPPAAAVMTGGGVAK